MAKLTIEDFLYAIQNYAEDIDGYYKNTNQKVNADERSWKVFADILKGRGFTNKNKTPQRIISEGF